MQQFIDDNLKKMTVLNERVTMASTLQEEKETELESTVQAILDSMETR